MSAPVFFNANEVAPEMVVKAIPAGSYRVAIVKVEKKPNKKENGSYMEFTFEVISGSSKGSRVKARLNLENPSGTAVAIARAELSCICHAVGVLTPPAPESLQNIPLVVDVSVSKFIGKDKKEVISNEIESYKSVEAASAAFAAGSVSPKPLSPVPPVADADKAPWDR